MGTLKFVLIFFAGISLYCSPESQVNSSDIAIITIDISDSASSDVDTINDLLANDFNILFIGNSLTYTNNLPELVKISGKQKKIKIGTKMIAFPNYAIIDHWEDGKVKEEIASKLYDFVIIQQGPSSQAYGREILIKYGEKYSTLCENNDAKLCFFMVWPSLTYYQTFSGVIKNHRDAAIINNAILCPVGEVWKEYFDATGEFDYYGPDGFHPSLKGSQIAAEVIIESLFTNK